jgi:transposase
MHRYIGIDAHTESCTVAVMGPSGKRLREARLETNGKVLTDFIRSLAGRKHICLEEGTQAEWLYEMLEPLADEVVVQLPERSDGVKNDSVDAWQRADELRRGDIKRMVYKAPGKFTALRAAVRAYEVTQRDMVRGKTRLNALYRSRGVQGMGSDIYDSDLRARWIAKLPLHQGQVAKLLSEQLDGLVQAQQVAEQWLLEEGKKVPIVRLLETAPGIGKIRAAQIVAVVVSPYRFRTRRQFWSYSGLGVTTRSSSDWIRDRDGRWVRRQTAQTRGLNRNRNPILKRVFTGAAESIIRRGTKQPLRHGYQRQLDAGTKPNLARLTMARRIAGAVLAMWKNQEEYDPAKQQ